MSESRTIPHDNDPNQGRHYQFAPIVEAVLEVKTVPSSDVSLNSLAKVVGQDSDFPHRREMIEATGQMKVGPSVSASASAKHVGFQYMRADEKIVLHVRNNGFAVSRLNPYTDWADVFATFTSYWDKYRDAATPKRIEQLSLRYINRFDLPETKLDLGKYFRTFPEVSPEIEYPLTGFMTHLQIQQLDIEALATIILAAHEPTKENHESILLDIELTKSVDLAADDDSRLNSEMSILRNRKNKLFEACINPAARDLLNETKS